MFKNDPKVKKILVRNGEKKIRSTAASSKLVVREFDDCSSLNLEKSSTSKENELSEPTLCSSAALASYLEDVKRSRPPPLSQEDLNVNKSQLCTKITKKLNFHFNDKIYRNLVELNASIDNIKTKKPAKHIPSSKKDLEPNIEDFCEEEEESDFPPNIPTIRPKLKPVRNVGDGGLHKLVASFEVL